ncbi:unnamed protein product, partial [Prorocentrum cordatum]
RRGQRPRGRAARGHWRVATAGSRSERVPPRHEPLSSLDLHRRSVRAARQRRAGQAARGDAWEPRPPVAAGRQPPALPGQPVSVGSGSVPAAEAQELNGAAQGVRGAACGGKPVDPATGEPCEPAAAADDVWSSNEGGDTPKAVGAADVFGDVHPAVDRQLTQSAGEISALREQQADQGEGSLLQR